MNHYHPTSARNRATPSCRDDNSLMVGKNLFIRLYGAVRQKARPDPKFVTPQLSAPVTIKHLLKLSKAPVTVLALSILAFATTYFILGHWPDHAVKKGAETANFIDCLYFSVLTISTLGYVDMNPTGWARGVVTIEVFFGLLFFGYFVSRIVSAKQEALIEYIANERIIQTYNECLEMLKDAKENIADRRRELQARAPVDELVYRLNAGNPFYPAMRALEILNGYSAHIVEVGKAGELVDRLDRAAHHVEELAAFTRKLINLLESNKVTWRTDRTQIILANIVQSLERFQREYVPHTRYSRDPYKAGQSYNDVLKSHATHIKHRVSGDRTYYELR